MKIQKELSRLLCARNKIALSCIRCRAHIQLFLITRSKIASSQVCLPPSASFKRVVKENNYFMCNRCSHFLVNSNWKRNEKQCQSCSLYKNIISDKCFSVCKVCALLVDYLLRASVPQREPLQNLTVQWNPIKLYASFRNRERVENRLMLFRQATVPRVYDYLKRWLFSSSRSKSVVMIPKLMISTNLAKLRANKALFKIPAPLRKKPEKKKIINKLPSPRKASDAQKFRKKPCPQYDEGSQLRKSLKKLKHHVIQTKDISELYPNVESILTTFMDHSHEGFLNRLAKAKDLIRQEQERMEEESTLQRQNAAPYEDVFAAETLIRHELKNMGVKSYGLISMPEFQRAETSDRMKYAKIGEKIVELEMQSMRKHNPYADVLCRQKDEEDNRSSSSTETLEDDSAEEEI